MRDRNPYEVPKTDVPHERPSIRRFAWWMFWGMLTLSILLSVAFVRSEPQTLETLPLQGLVILASIHSLWMPFLIASLPTSAARRLCLASVAVLLPTWGISCGQWVSSGEAGFLAPSQWVCMGSLVPLVAVSLGWLGARAILASDARKLETPEV